MQQQQAASQQQRPISITNSVLAQMQASNAAANPNSSAASQPASSTVVAPASSTTNPSQSNPSNSGQPQSSAASAPATTTTNPAAGVGHQIQQRLINTNDAGKAPSTAPQTPQPPSTPVLTSVPNQNVSNP